MTQNVFFFHTPKAAGTSIKEVIESFYSEEQRSPLVENDKVQHDSLGGDYSRFKGYAYYGGHYGYDVYTTVKTDHVPITLFRKCIPRLISLYKYFRYLVDADQQLLHSEKYFAVLSAKTLTFADFVLSDDPRIAVFTNNQHYRQLSASPWDLHLEKNYRQTFDFIDQMPWYNVLEHAQDSFEWAQKFWGSELPPFPHLNKSTQVPVEAKNAIIISNELSRNILQRNEFDNAIYEHAEDRLRQLKHKPTYYVP
jgi:hypothetical protein